MDTAWAFDSCVELVTSPLSVANAALEPLAGVYYSKPLTIAFVVSFPHALIFRCLPTRYKATVASVLGILHIRWYSGPIAWLTIGLVALSFLTTKITLSRQYRIYGAWAFVILATYCVHIVGELFEEFSYPTLYSRFMAFACGQRIVSLASNFDFFQGQSQRQAALARLRVLHEKPRRSAKSLLPQRDLVRRLALADAPPPTFIEYLAWMLHPGSAIAGAFHEWADYNAALRGCVAATDTYYSVLAGNGARLSGNTLHGASQKTKLLSLRDSLWDASGAFLYGAAGIASILLLWETFSMHGYMLGLQERYYPWWHMLHTEFPHITNWELPNSFADAWEVLVFIAQRGAAVWWERGLSLTAWAPAAALLGRLWVFHWFIAQPVRYGWWHLGESICIISGIGYTPSARHAARWDPHALDDMKPRPSDGERSALLLRIGTPSPSFCTIILHNWSNTTTTEVFPLHRSSEFRKLIRLWNPRMSWWLDNYVHKTIYSGFGLNYVVTYLVDGLMHGTHWGSFFTYASFTYFSQVDKLLLKHVQIHDKEDSWKCFWRRVVIGAYGNLNINYMFIAYTMKPWPMGLLAWAEMGFALHVSGVVLWIVLLFVDWQYPKHSVQQFRRPRRPMYMFAVDSWQFVKDGMGLASSTAQQLKKKTN